MHPPVATTHPLPMPGDPGAFATVRRFDVHTGVDLYCEEGAPVSAVEAGTIVAIERFTGEHAGSPWWNNTWAVLVEGESGVLVYGEVVPAPGLTEGSAVIEGQLLGHVTQVLKKDKGVTPTVMLHFERMQTGARKTLWWRHAEKQPAELLDPTVLLRRVYE